MELKTDGSIGSNEKVMVEFSTDSGVRAGGVILHFTAPPQYELAYCISRTNFPAELPTDTNKVWKISLTRTSSIRLVIHCNEEEVVNILLSESTCSYSSQWSDTWNKDIKQIRFEEDDTASDYYRVRGRYSYNIENSFLTKLKKPKYFYVKLSRCVVITIDGCDKSLFSFMLYLIKPLRPECRLLTRGFS